LIVFVPLAYGIYRLNPVTGGQRAIRTAHPG
jgi:hypothetical protein